MEKFSKNAYIKTMIEDKNEQRKQLLLSKIAQFRLFDDDFMSKVFEDDIEATEFLLKIILQRDDLEVTESKGQVSIKNLLGRSVRLDIKAKDKNGKLYNIEVQRADSGAGEKRARYYSAILDANSLLPRQDFDKLPETYVIFITEHDVFKGGLPL
ncbi:MAG: PD-(D/E)XK nuclease family transposase, partial [Treponema sp.]|nr:PD-(D/E)XK nuclease family transposase [Treponema sp.]